ncbi:Ribokinase-like protein [Dichotomocladium elegans]|nr:Ribokinase-like protein [Dichotomocladium elegans]
MVGKILNYGSVNLDQTFPVPHIVQPGETLSATGFFERAGGKGANQSAALARAKAHVYHAGLIGYDAAWVKNYMEERGVDMTYTKISENVGNGRAFIQVCSETGENCIVLFPGTNAKYVPEDAAEVLKDFGKGDWVVLQNEISHGGDIMRLAADKGLSVLFNPAPMTPNIIKEFPFDKVSILIVNETEAKSLYEQITDEKVEAEELELVGKVMAKFPTMQGMVLTLGGKGVVAKFRDGKVKDRDFIVPAQKVKVKDTTGAGDTFVGFFLAAFVRAQNEDYFTRVQHALEEANIASSIAVQREGSMDSVPLLNEVQERKKQLN